VSTEESSLQKEWITIRPNPTTDMIQVIISDQDRLRQIDLINTAGSRLMSMGALNVAQQQLSLNSYAPGVYFLRIQTDHKTVMKRLIVQ